MSGGAPSLANDAAPLAFGGAPPDALLLSTCECVLEARNSYVALFTHGLGARCVVVLVRVEHPRIESPTGSQFPPHNDFG